MKKQILVLDDEPDVLEMLPALLGDDFAVTTFDRGLDALIAILERMRAGHSFDLLILDCALPHFDGFTIAKIVRMAEATGIVDCPCKIAAFTAYQDTVDQTTLVERSGIDAYWKKVEDVNNLPEMAKALLETNEA